MLLIKCYICSTNIGFDCQTYIWHKLNYNIIHHLISSFPALTDWHSIKICWKVMYSPIVTRRYSIKGWYGLGLTDFNSSWIFFSIWGQRLQYNFQIKRIPLNTYPRKENRRHLSSVRLINYSYGVLILNSRSSSHRVVGKQHFKVYYSLSFFY